MKITAIKQQVKRADRYSVYVDDRYAFSLSESALLTSKIASGQEIDKQQLQDYKKLSQDDKSYGMALRYAAMRLRSEWEMTTYLRRKQVEEPVADSIMARLRKIGLLDDEAFATAWVENRRQLKPTSLRKLQQELKQKHVPDTIIQQVLRDDPSDERAVLRQMAEKKFKIARYQAEPEKLMAYLARQGFGYEDIKTVLAELREA
jgi:regulatory protein